MSALRLLFCVGLSVFSAHAKVVTTFRECSTFFYNGNEPAGMDQNSEKICQKLSRYSGYFYATLYSVPHRIPLYSAYTLDPDCSSTAGRSDDWHIEPQISDPGSRTAHMVKENDRTLDLSSIRVRQALSTDYAESGYDRGHLNPNSFQSEDGRAATFTLTNAAPMDPCFNRIQWKNWESTLRTYLLNKLRQDGDAVAYIVTGTVPKRNLRIPPRQISGEPERVTVPSHIWTAVCYKHNSDEDQSLSFAYLGTNSPLDDISLMTVSDLNAWLSEQTLAGRVKIFNDDCFGGNNKLNKVHEVFQNLKIRQSSPVYMSSSAVTTYNAVKRTVTSPSLSSKRVRVSKMTVQLAFDSLMTYSSVTETLKALAGSACLITSVKLFGAAHRLSKRNVPEAYDAVECLLVPERQQTATDGSSCSSISTTFLYCRCYSEKTSKPCCSSPCLYHDKLQSYRCYSGTTLLECSPRYSLITATGERCRDDHPCATYGEDHYWCYTASGGSGHCSPPPRSRNTEKHQSCRIDEINNRGIC